MEGRGGRTVLMAVSRVGLGPVCLAPKRRFMMASFGVVVVYRMSCGEEDCGVGKASDCLAWPLTYQAWTSSNRSGVAERWKILQG